jgi:hypothetical protein
MEVQVSVDSGVRAKQGPDKSSAGDDILRGPLPNQPDRGLERQGPRRTQDSHLVTTQALVHAAGADMEDTDTITHLPPSSGVHGMLTRAKAHTSADVLDPNLSLARPPFRNDDVFTVRPQHNMLLHNIIAN